LEEMHRKTIDPVTGRLFLKHSLQDDIRLKLEREKERFLERFGHIQSKDEFKLKEEEVADQMKIIKHMQLDEDKVMPNDRHRHWMLAQTHILIKEGAEEDLKAKREILERLGVKSGQDFVELSEVEKQRAENAYNTIKNLLKSKKDFQSDNLIDNFLMEKAHLFEDVRLNH
jgi:hypothetical protein